MAVDFPAPEKPVITTRSVSAEDSTTLSLNPRADGGVPHLWRRVACSYGTMPPVIRRRARFALVAALATMLAGPAVARADLISASVSATPTGQAMRSGFLGVSFEYRAVHQYTGRNPLAINPVLIGLLKAMSPGQSPILRIGGDSADGTWWPIPGMIAPAGLYYRLTPGWMRTTQALASDLGAKLILGINLAAGRPAIAAAEGRALLAGIG